jgi:hypothetical protein
MNVPTIPTAAKDSTAFIEMLPIIAVSVIDNKGSETPDINAGMASLFMCFKLMVFSKTNTIRFYAYFLCKFNYKTFYI